MKETIRGMSKKYKYAIIIIVLAIFSLVTLYSFAYLESINNDEASTNIGGTGEGASGLIFNGEEISFVANTDNFGYDDNNVVLTINPSVEAYANGINYKEYYDIVLNISDNTFEYTLDNKPELILTITDPNGFEIDSINGLDYVTQNGVSGFDVTSAIGTIPVELDRKILSNDINIEEWEFTLTFMSYLFDQSINENKVFNISIDMDVNDHEVKYNNFLQLIINDNNETYENLLVKEDPYLGENPTTHEGIFATEDSYTSVTNLRSIYYRGAVDNNWMYFAGFYWRIIRIAGDGSVKLIYSGAEAPTEDEKVLGNSNDISKYAPFASALATSLSHYTYHGYMYELYVPHSNVTDSILKGNIDSWYESEILGIDEEKYIADTMYCNDRVVYYSGNDYELLNKSYEYFDLKNSYYFGSYLERDSIYYGSYLSLICKDKRDAFTVNDADFGNADLTYPIATLTADEYILSGQGTESYLFLKANYHSLSPSHSVYTMAIGYSGFSLMPITSAAYVRPVIAIDSNVEVTGNGEYNNPYQIVGYYN